MRGSSGGSGLRRGGPSTCSVRSAFLPAMMPRSSNAQGGAGVVLHRPFIAIWASPSRAISRRPPPRLHTAQELRQGASID